MLFKLFMKDPWLIITQDMPAQSRRALQFVNYFTTTACFIGFTLSFYALMVEIHKENDPSYEAFCDINSFMRCSRALSSEYGKGFGFLGKIFGEKSIFNQPNSLHGMAFYTLYFVMNMVNTRVAINIMIGFAILSNIVSLYLASILIFILKDFCVVCISTYFINATLLFLSMYKKHIVGKLLDIQDESSVEDKKES